MRALLPLLIFLSACTVACTGDAPPPPVRQLLPAEAVAAVEDRLGDAVMEHDAGQQDAALEVWADAWAMFQADVHPALRAHDPMATLQLELHFGRVRDLMKKPGRRQHQKVRDATDALFADLTAQAAALPPPPPATPQPTGPQR